MISLKIFFIAKILLSSFSKQLFNSLITLVYYLVLIFGRFGSNILENNALDYLIAIDSILILSFSLSYFFNLMDFFFNTISV